MKADSLGYDNTMMHVFDSNKEFQFQLHTRNGTFQTMSVLSDFRADTILG